MTMTKVEEKRSVQRSSRLRPSSANVTGETESNGVATAVALEKDSEQIRLEEALRRSKFKNHALLSVVADLVFVVRKDGTILEFHGPKDNDFALGPDGLLGKTVKELLPSQIAQQAMFYLEKTLRTGESQSFICPYQLPERLRDFQARLATAGPDEVVVLVRDVTDRRRLEKEIVEISSREQIRIGQDLHDGLGQHLTGVTFLTRALENKLAALSLPEAADAAEIGQLVLQALSQTRNLARGVFPAELESSGLVEALIELAGTVQKLFRISCRFEGDTSIMLQDRQLANHLFRLAQEAINNSVKHGKAKQVIIALRKSGDQTVLAVHDDGIGFPVQGFKTNGLGLRIMHYRAQKIGGSFEIQSSPNGGTIVSCSFRNPATAEPGGTSPLNGT